MERLVSDTYANLIKECPSQDINVENTYKVFKKYYPIIAKQYGILLYKVTVAEPGRGRFEPQLIRELMLVDESEGRELLTREFLFEMGNGGYSKIMVGISQDSEWTEELEDNVFLLSRTFFLLLGRTRVMSDLHRMTFTDPMTGIANKTQLMRFAMNLIVEGEIYGYCANFINIKNMKLLNNRFSERAGDQILTKYTGAISDFLGPKNCIARLGGDNFSVFIQAEKEEEFLEFMRHLQVTLEMPETDRRVEVKIDSRVGYYFMQPGDGIDAAMDCSNIAMSFAKQDIHPDIMRFESWMKTQMIQLKELEESIPEAIANEEFILYYQPKADISDPNDFKLCGAEALVRWRRDGEMVHPGNFIPIIEKNGMVTLVDFYVLEHVCKDIKRWMEMGLKPVRISSNFSRRHLKDKYFADKVEAIFNKYEIDPSYLEIEITESYDVDDLEALTRFEQRMHKLGINMSVDDFGSGFSSLKVIKNIVADVIKLDKSLIDGVGTDPDDDIIVSHLIQMIQSLGKEIIAEGVEQKCQADFLRANNCNCIQGYMYARPMPVVQFEAYLERDNK